MYYLRQAMLTMSKLTDYAIVVLAEMSRKHGAMLAANTLADDTNLPEPTVSKILKLLSKAEIIRSTRGSKGGYTMDRDPHSISIASIIKVIDGPIALTACVDGSDKQCSIEGSCSLKGRWDPINRAVMNALENVSLLEVIADRSKTPCANHNIQEACA